MPDSFADLLERARNGDAVALTELVRQYEPEVRIVARVRLGPALRPHLDSIDLVQSVHKSVMVGLRDRRFAVSSPEKLIALALTILRRKVARRWRQLRRQQRLSHGPAATTSSLPETLAALQSPEPDPHRAAEVAEAIQRVCRSLSDRDRQLLECRLQGLNTAEAARELNEDPDSARVRLSRLRQYLRDAGLVSDWL